MKRMTASEARRRWFEVLDRVAAGEAVAIERKGWRIVLRREAPEAGTQPDYSDIVQPAEDIDEADLWSWELEEGELRPVTRRK